MADDSKATITPDTSGDERGTASSLTAALTRLEAELTALLGEMINDFEGEFRSDTVHEHLEVLRALLTSQTTAYIAHILRRSELAPTTSEMYEKEVGPGAVVTTTLRGLIEGGTVSVAQAARLAGYVSERRTLLVFGDRATGKSTLLNALLELVSVDERFVSIEHHDHLPALTERSFCVRLSVDDDTDVEALSTKALKMQPSRIVVGEVHADEILYFFRALHSHPKIGGFTTLRADSVHKAVAKLVRQLQLQVEPAEAKRLVGDTRPVFAHMRSDEQGMPRLGALWSVEGLDAKDEILLGEDTAGDAGALLA